MALDAIATQTEPLILQSPILAQSLLQLATSFGGFFATCAAMYACFEVSAWIALPLSIVAAGFLVRIFIIQHDCGHGSFFKSRRANDLLGIVCSLMTLAPYAFWRRQHARHHGSWNNLDRRAASGMDIYPDSPDEMAFGQLRAPISDAKSNSYAGSSSRIPTDPTGERRNWQFRQRFRGLRSCRPNPSGESGPRHFAGRSPQHLWTPPSGQGKTSGMP